MNEETGTSEPCIINSSKDTIDWKLCILCQESTTRKGTLVQNPKTESYQKLLDVVEERASLQDGVYVGIHGYLKQFNKEAFFEKKPLWHCIVVILMPQIKQGSAHNMPCVQEAML